MAAASYEDPTEDLNVQGDSIAREFEDFEESEKETEEQPLNDSLDTSHSEDSLGPRKRNLTAKGLEGRLSRFSRQRINALRAVSRKRTEVSQLVVDINDLHLVKKELINLNDLIEHYKEAFNAYYGDLTDDEDRRREHAHPDEKIKDIMENLYPVHAWVSQAEGRLADQLERASRKRSERKSKASSRLSARDEERVCLAELKAERSLLNQRQALQAAEEDLDLELEIVKAEAREKALNEMDKDHEVRLRHAVQVHHQLPYPLSQLCCRLFLRHYPMILYHPLKHLFLLIRHLVLQRPRLRQVCRAQETL